LLELIENMTEFFKKKFNLKLIAIDINYNIIHKYVPETENKKINPWTLYLLIHNNYCYQLNAKLKRLDQIVNKQVEKDITISFKYFFSEKIEVITFLNDINKLNTLDFKDTDKICKVHYNGDMKKLLENLVFEAKYIPILKYNGKQLKIIIKIGQINVIISNSGQSNDLQTEFENGKYYLKFAELEKELYDNILNKNTISNYSKSLLDAFNQYFRSLLICFFKELME
jgi:hypothetical protein